jgi:hypothetical protein
VVRRSLTLIACALACALPATAHAAAGSLGSAPQPARAGAGALPGRTATGASSSFSSSAASAANPEAPVPVPASEEPPAGRRLSASQVLAIAGRLAKMKSVRREYPGSYGGAYLKPAFHWQVSYFSKNGKKEIGQVIIDDLSGRVLEQWTGFQVAWSMARGYQGAFGRHAGALYIWLPLCVLFMLAFIDWRRPLQLLHLDLLALLSFSVSLAFFNHAHIYASVPLAYPPLLYLLARMLALTRRRSRQRGTGAHWAGGRRISWLALGVVFLLAFRIALNVTDANVIDVGYAGVIGAQRIVDSKPLYGHYPADNEHGDTYGPVNYEAYVPFEQIFGWSGKWDDLPAAHAAAVVFDLLAVALMFLLGRRIRGPSLGIALAYAWVSYPFTLFALESNSNDTLVAVLILAALLLASSAPARGAFAALAGLSKFAPLALAPLLATHGLRGSDGWVSISALRSRAFALFLLAFVVVGALVSVPALSHDSLHTIYERTIDYQANRNSPFSVWGLYGLPGPQRVVQLAAIALAIALAIVPRRDDLVGLAATCAAVMIATQLGVEHWFYLYIPWFFGLVMIALLGTPPSRAGVDGPTAQQASQAQASAPARWSPLASAPHSGSALP